MNKFKVVTVWLVIIVAVILIIQALQSTHSKPVDLTYSEFLDEVTKDNVEEVTIKGYSISGRLRKAPVEKFRSYAPIQDDALVAVLREHKVKIKAEEAGESMWLSALITWFPLILLIGIWLMFLRQMQGSGKNALMFGKSRAKLSTSQQRKVTFADVAGVDEAKEELQEIIEFLRDPTKFKKLGGRIPKGVLLIGPPGTGKTLLARAIAGEADVPFFSISGSDFVELYVGVGASRVRDLFDQGKKHAPCLIFVDEIDAVGRHRGAGLGGGHDEREQTLNQMLVEMDGFESNDGVILIAATNRPDILDPALLRPGRFDRQVVVDRPDVKGRLGILKVHTRNIPLGDDVNLEIIARSTPGFAGADLANLVNEAALLAARENKDSVSMEDFEQSKDKVMMGAERRSLVLNENEKEITAIHEAGHALVAWLLPKADPLHKVTIIPRGRALGVTQQIPLDDKRIYTESYLLDKIDILLGGRVAEEILLAHYSSGASSDIEQATDIARTMVCKLGMSRELGPLTFGKHEEQIFLGKELAYHKDYSEATALKIDREVHRIVSQSYDRTTALLTDNQDKLRLLAVTLREREVLDMRDIDELLGSTKNASYPDQSSNPQEVQSASE
ncbi:ATP-dependent zinc metalloprotease FtsH [bacterium]|nr:ATP-dependent zinc metalloprotease FtsH [candidate division CSSED10-310 bacterium]